ncbi:MAG: N-acetylmuramoyl-L-alanine amidase [Bacteroidota bacterium]|nr:N-acetylmuramoyl-L-alanine amidase [Bacteroidota bacterium]MDP4206070.1 N-acetylmuramoyl-L-alanine amidase [Bacteroidota bacterium]
MFFDKKYYLLATINILLTICGFAANIERPTHHITTIVLDPGHGGQDTGANYKNAEEKNIVLDVALRLGKLINERMSDVKVVYTRDQDVFIPLHQRAEIANKIKADLFMCIHANACKSPSIYGAETYVLGLHRTEENLEVAKKENSVILLESDHSTRYEGFDPNSPESYIIFELVQDQYLSQSMGLARKIQKSFGTVAGRVDRGVKQAGFLVLRRTAMPSVLVEMGYLSNDRENEYLLTETGREAIAESLFNAFKNYKDQEEDKESPMKLAQTAPAKEAPVQEQSSKVVANGPNPAPEATASHNDADNIFSFTIQLAMTAKELSTEPKHFKGLEGIKKYKAGKTWKYCYGEDKDFDQIKNLLDKIRNKFPDAFIIGLESGQPVSLQRVLQQIR